MPDQLTLLYETEALRNPTVSYRGTWEEHRRRETQFQDTVPSVIIIGGGHVGLEVAARLKNLDVPTLVVEQNERIGDNVTFLCHSSPSS
jgi:pyruvate/2-oxoglutarate dehydrogenase complex dihydrolipoamide dehydrogenase (E3) component